MLKGFVSIIERLISAPFGNSREYLHYRYRSPMFEYLIINDDVCLYITSSLQVLDKPHSEDCQPYDVRDDIIAHACAAYDEHLDSTGETAPFTLEAYKAWIRKSKNNTLQTFCKVWGSISTRYTPRIVSIEKLRDNLHCATYKMRGATCKIYFTMREAV